jgi:tetratricopeptide (TPR) repeat protein
MKRRVLAILLLALFGAVKMPFENALDAAQRQAKLRQTALDLNLRERVGQMGFIAALSGFRSPLAAYLWIEAHNAWERTEWGRMAGLFDTVTTLQPRSLTYWDMAAWHMAWNASKAALDDPKQPSEALRIRNQRQFFKIGRDYLERGIQNNPDSYVLYAALGNLLQQKMEDHCGAAEAYLKASEFPDAPLYISRLAGYEMAKCPGREREAYQLLKRLYDESPEHHKPTLISTLKELEKKLDVPPAERIDSSSSQS